MQWARSSRALLRWGLGGIVLAAAALALLFWAGDERAGAAEPAAPTPGLGVALPEPVDGVVGGLATTVEPVVGGLLDPVIDDTGAVVVPGVGPVDPGALPGVGEVLDPGIGPLPVPALPIPVPPALPVTTPVVGTAVLGVPTHTASAGPTVPDPTSAIATSRLRDGGPASGTVDDPAPAAGGDLDPRTGDPAAPRPDPLGPLGTVAAAAVATGAPGLVLVAVLAACVWAAAHGPGRRLRELTAVALGGPPVAFERPG